jgi:hypothetical protein
LDQMRKFVEMDGTTWTLTHAFYANMGGFVLKIESSPTRNPAGHVSPKDTDCQVITLRPDSDHDDTQSVASPKHDVAPECHDNPVSASSLTNNEEEKAIKGQSTVRQRVAPAVAASSPTSQHVEMEAPIVTEILRPNAKSENTEYAYLNADQLYALREDMVIAQLPDVPLKEIEDKSKGDAFVKGTAVTQVLWLVIQVIARGARRLPVSQIEIAAIAFSACTLLTHIHILLGQTTERDCRQPRSKAGNCEGADQSNGEYATGKYADRLQWCLLVQKPGHKAENRCFQANTQ